MTELVVSAIVLALLALMLALVGVGIAIYLIFKRKATLTSLPEGTYRLRVVKVDDKDGSQTVELELLSEE